MSTTEAVVQEAREQVLDALRTGERFLLATHEHPDGDALGSLRRHARHPRRRSARTR